MRSITVSLLTLLLALSLSLVCFAYDDVITHPSLAEKTIKKSGINKYLTSIGFVDGVETLSNGDTIKSWLVLGSTAEDSPNCRAANHFHNPLTSWDKSGASDFWPQDTFCQAAGWTPRYSNITWATGLTSRNQTKAMTWNKQDMGYDDARKYFYNALTTTDTATREVLFANTFQAVGQALHLLQDMAVPAHVRNDFLSHLIYDKVNPGGISKWFLNPFETYVKDNDNELFSAISSLPPPSIAGAKPTDFWDTDGLSSAFSQGLAESTNAGYFSDFTIPGNPHIPFSSSHNFPAPQIPAYTCSDTVPGTNDVRKYVSRQPCPTDGSPIEHLAVLSMFTPRLLGMPSLPLPFINKYALDENVHKDYAKLLLPRAVGYSAALLDYFFRGKLSATYNTGDITFHSAKFTVSNTTPNETAGVGDVSLIIRYKALVETGNGPVKTLALQTTDYTYKVVTLKGINLSEPQPLIFNFGNKPLPMHLYEIEMQLVFKGKLGNEEEAVAVSKWQTIDGIATDFTLSLPPSGVYANTSDSSSATATFNEMRANVNTDLPGGFSGGEFSLELEFRTAKTDQFQSVLVDTNPTDGITYLYRVLVKNDVTVLPQNTPVELVFDLPQLPVQATDVEINIIYTKADGTWLIANEDISEPTPVDVFNNTDYTCINNTWYKYDEPEAVAIRSTSDTSPHAIADIAFLTASAGSTVLDPGATNILSAVGPVLTGDTLRLGYILTDYANSYAFRSTKLGNTYYPFPVTANTSTFAGAGFKNDGATQYPMFAFRGKQMWGRNGVVFVNNEYPANSDCTWDALKQKLGL